MSIRCCGRRSAFCLWQIGFDVPVTLASRIFRDWTGAGDHVYVSGSTRAELSVHVNARGDEGGRRRKIVKAILSDTRLCEGGTVIIHRCKGWLHLRNIYEKFHLHFCDEIRLYNE